jgi:hypothetical protein
MMCLHGCTKLNALAGDIIMIAIGLAQVGSRPAVSEKEALRRGLAAEIGAISVGAETYA